MGMFMLLLSNYVEHWLGKEHEKPNIEMLTALFFSLNVLAATQDIVVDGWALTMLKRYSCKKYNPVSYTRAVFFFAGSA